MRRCIPMHETMRENPAHTVPPASGVTVLTLDPDGKALHEEAPADQTGAQIERIGRITGSFAHHFNNMLTSVIGYADLVSRRLAEGDPARAHAEMIIKSACRGSSMVSRLLAFGRKVHLRPRPLDLNTLILAMKPRIGLVLGSGIDFETRLAPCIDPAYSDPEQLERVLMDLVVNSCEAMPDGGRLVLGTARIEVDRPRNRQGIRIAPGTYAAISLRDSGVGMDDQTRTLAFDPFFTTKQGALGLGLSSAYGFVKQSGGYIWLHGRPGKGALVTLYLPVIRRDDPEGSGEPS